VPYILKTGHAVQGLTKAEPKAATRRLGAVPGNAPRKW
jgi:hypothetical protein